MTEKQLQNVVVHAAKLHGFLAYHTYDSRRSEPGFPDLVLVHPSGGVLWRELKTEKGRTSQAQDRWIATLTAAGQDIAIWRPKDWFDGTILNQLAAARTQTPKRSLNAN